MTFPQAGAELRANFPMAAMSPTAVRGECFERATGVDFKKSKGWLYVGRDREGRELLLYYNDMEHLICCTESVHDE